MYTGYKTRFIIVVGQCWKASLSAMPYLFSHLQKAEMINLNVRLGAKFTKYTKDQNFKIIWPITGT